MILWHAVPSVPNSPASSHFDLMFECTGHLITFQMEVLPIPGEKIGVRRIGNHRIAFLEFEGPLTAAADGTDRGHVTRWTRGFYRIEKWSRDKSVIALDAPRLDARIVLFPRLGELEIPPSPPHAPSIFWPEVKNWDLRASRWDIKKNV